MRISRRMVLSISLIACVLLFAVTLQSKDNAQSNDKIDTLHLFKTITENKAFYSQRTGEAAQFNYSDEVCIADLIKKSDSTAYYKLKKNGYKGSYDIYGKDSQYAADVKALATHLDDLMRSFHRSGLIAEIVRRGRTPALMFDIDNTLEFSAGIDGDPTGNGPPIKGTVAFAKRHCFKDNIVCYFITARDCDKKSTAPTLKWVKDNLALSEEQAKKYTYFSGIFRSEGCLHPPNTSIAYKDIIRHALEEEENIFWLMSIGDQLTDSLGRHSGMKIEVPNQFFHSDTVPNQLAPYGKGNCNRTVTVAPDETCSKKLLKTAVEHSSFSFCEKRPNP